ncbi:15509_t:CDS:2 [Rhizophagus irregularis]|nr:15509_t:CDS:2 [Rhizophagus irregularis]
MAHLKGIREELALVMRLKLGKVTLKATSASELIKLLSNFPLMFV